MTLFGREVVAVPRRGRGHTLWGQVWWRFRRKKVGMASLAVIVILYMAGILAPWITPYDYNEQQLTRETIRQGPTLAHPFGTDHVGRDVLTRIIFSLRTTVIVTVVSIITGSLFLGIFLGLLAGYYGRWVDSLIMRVGEVFLAFPGLLLVILIAATVKPRVLQWVRAFEDATGIKGIVQLGVVDYLVVFGALAAFSWVGMARLVRGQVLALKSSQFVEAAKAAGASTTRILFIHILPNVLGPVIVVVSMGMATAAGSEVVLSWLGIGIQPPTPSLGQMITDAGVGLGISMSLLREAPHLLLFPVGTIALIIFAWNLLGDALNDAINPRAR